ncbi:MAG: hypothetical protein M9894_08865 [Planctomycetes bacterium]|nr:hypothetical protein [Planctomycetota bacterium]
MAKLLVLANLELALELPDDAGETNELARQKERQLLRLLRRLVSEDPKVKGSVETLEFEAFTYASPLEEEAKGYYYNKHEKVERP